MDLREFGINPDPPAPRIQKRTPIYAGLNEDGTRRTVGHVGLCPDRGDDDVVASVFVTKRDSHDHRIRALDAYAISEDALPRLTDRDIKRLFVHETDTGHVYEYRMRQFTEGPNVPNHYLATRGDPQRFVTRDDAAYTWADHGGRLYLPRGDLPSVAREWTDDYGDLEQYPNHPTTFPTDQ